MFVVVIIEKGGSQQKVEFEQDAVSIGRVQGNDVILPRGNVSKRHAKLEYKDGQFFLEDVGSTNGTYVNGRRIQESSQILKGDKIYIGEYILSLEGHDSLEPVEDKKQKKTSSPPKSRAQAPSLPRPRALSRTSEGHSPTIPDDIKSSAPRLPRPSMVSPPPADDAKKDTLPPPEEAAPRKPAPGKSTSGKAVQKRNDEVSTGTAELYIQAETVLDYLATQIKVIDRKNAPTRVDSGTAAKVRFLIKDYLIDLEGRNKLPPSTDKAVLRGKAFRAAVNLGPLTIWLDNPEVETIRITGPQSIFLRKHNEWIRASNGFSNKEDMQEVLRCLGAGLEIRDNSAPGIFSYRLEEGYWVFSAFLTGAKSSPAVVIDKQAALSAKEVSSKALDKKAYMVIQEAIEARAKIAVVGESNPARLSIIGALLNLLPADDFVVSVEDMPLQIPIDEKNIRFCIRGTESEGRCGEMGAWLFHALGLEPTWLVVSGTRWDDVPQVLTASAGRLGVLAELPFGGVGQLDSELTLAMAVSGAPIQNSEAALLLDEAFDIIVFTKRDKNGVVVVEKILACAISQKGQWAPNTLFDRSENR